MKCPSCDSDVPPGARFCAYCGMSLRVCQTCSTVWEAEASFCGSCGGSLLVELPRREISTQRLISHGDTSEVDETVEAHIANDSCGFLYFPQFPDRRFEIGEGELTVGAGDKNDIIIERPAVSWNHALLIVRDSGLKIQDSASTNGTFVNDIRVSRPRGLSHGDLVRFGNVELKIWLRPTMRG